MNNKLVNVMWKKQIRDIPGGPVVKTPRSQCRGPGFDPWSGNEVLHAATKTQCSQVNKYLAIMRKPIERAQLLSCVWFFATPWTIACQAPLFMEFSRQEYWSGLPCPPPGDLLDSGIKPVSPPSPALAGGFFTTEPSGKPHRYREHTFICSSGFQWRKGRGGRDNMGAGC